MSKPKEYKLETSSDGKKWTHRATFREGDMSRFGVPFSPEVVLMEGRSFIDSWSMQHRSYDKSILNHINERKHVRVIIEL
jgi:hypothetical protein